MSTQYEPERVFAYRVLRGLVGFIAIFIASVTAFVALIGDDAPLHSISASYHSDAQDLFVGALFIVGAFLLAYRGKNNRLEYAASKLASVAVVCVALFPTSVGKCCADQNANVPEYILWVTSLIHVQACTVHLWSAVVFFVLLFVIMVIFAIRALCKDNGECRALVYTICALGMVASVGLAIVFRDGTPSGFGGLFWAEFFALVFFGLGWLYSGLYEWLGHAHPWLQCPTSVKKFMANFKDRAQKISA